jgi:hypothetical protein
MAWSWAGVTPSAWARVAGTSARSANGAGYAIGKGEFDVSGVGEREPCLADATRAGEGQQWNRFVQHEGASEPALVLPADQPGARNWRRFPRASLDRTRHQATPTRIERRASRTL